MSAPPTDCGSTLRLPDGRRLTFTDTGPRHGHPVIYCHGAIGTPLRDTIDLPAIAARLRVRHIAINRPGFGGSDALPDRCVLQFADDAAAVADALSIERFSLVGVSAGGPYALGAARALGDRVIRVAVCSALSPLCAPHRTPGMTGRIRLGLAALAAAPAGCRVLGDAVLPVLRRRPVLLHAVIAAHAAPQAASPAWPSRGSGSPPARASLTRRHMVSAG